MVPLKVGLVGCGRLAERGWLPALEMARIAGTARLAAIAESDPGRRETAARGAGLDSSAAFADWRDLIAAGQADAVVLALAGRAQVEPAAAATGAGMSVLVEKPPGGDLAGAAELARLHPAPAVGFSRRFDAAWGALQAAACRTAPPHALELGLSYRRDGWGAHVVHDDALADLGSHVADLTAWISGAAVVRARCSLLEADSADGELELADGHGTARFAVAQSRPYAELGRLAGSSTGVRRGGWWRNALGRVGAGPDATALARSLHAELTAFARAIAGGGNEGVASALDGVRCQAVLDALRASARAKGEWVDVTLPAESR